MYQQKRRTGRPTHKKSGIVPTRWDNPVTNTGLPELDERKDDRWTGGPCLSLSAVIPTRSNPAPGLKHGPLIPYYRIRRVMNEFGALTTGYHIGRVQRLVSPVLASVEDGTWTNADANAPSGMRRYVDPDAIRLFTNVDAADGVHVLGKLLHAAQNWARELQQDAIYIEVHGLGRDQHYIVRPSTGEREIAS